MTTERPLRVAMLSEHASPAARLGGADAGGQNVYVDEVSRHLGALGYSVDVFTRREDTESPRVVDWAPGVRIVNVVAGPPEALPKDAVWPYMPQFERSILDFMRGDGARYDLLHGNFWMSGHVATRLGRRLRAPVVQIFHAMGLTKRRHQGEADTSASERVDVERAVVRAADRLIAQCPSERDELVGDYGADPSRVALIPSGVDGERYRPVLRDEARARIGLNGDGPVVVYVGRMLPRKDVRNVVRAVALLASGDGQAARARLLLVGGDAPNPEPDAVGETGELQRLAEELGIRDRVLVVGQRQPDVLRYYYCAGDVAVSTPWYEPFGLTPLEAMACGRPIVGSAVGGLTYTIADGQTGFLVPPRDPGALAARLRELLTDAAMRDAFGRAARTRAERYFAWPVVAARTAVLYQEVVSCNVPPTSEQASLALPRSAIPG